MIARNQLDRDLLTRSMVGRYKLGQEQTALYLAGSLFESLINSKLEAQGDQLERLELKDKIDKLNNLTRQNDSIFHRRDVFTEFFRSQGGVPTSIEFSERDSVRNNQVASRLHNFRWLRNRIMHNQMDQVERGDKTKEDLITYLWSELSPESFELAMSKRKGKQPIIETLFDHSADYMIRAIEEVEARQRDLLVGHDLQDAQINAKDFENLYDLRSKLVPLKNYLSIWLSEHASFLQTDVLTTIDTTSAYIWMPLVPQQAPTKEKRSGVYDCSVSLLATPLDLRIYMDFGGYNRDKRKHFYDFLAGSPEYDAVTVQFKDKPCFEVFDIDWYSSIFNRRPFASWLSGREKCLSDAKKKLNSAPKPKNSPITWNRCLHGYIFNKFDLGEENCIDFSMIEQPLKVVIEFYLAFNQYVQRIEKETSRA